MHIFASVISSRHPDIATLSSASFSFFAALSIFIGVYLRGKTDMDLFFTYAWSLTAPIITISLAFASQIWFLIAMCLLGALYGNFLTRFFVSFSDLTAIRERGRVGGFIGSISILVMSLLTVVSIFIGFFGSVVLCSLLSICSFLTTKLSAIDPPTLNVQRKSSPKTNSDSRRDFLLYLIPWLIYNLINSISGPYGTTSLIERFQISIVAVLVLSEITSCTGALLGGFAADIYGRKKALYIGLASYGISSAFSGLIYWEIQNRLLVFLLFALNGFSWGIFLVLYFFVVWGDLSNTSNSLSNYAGLGIYPLIVGLSNFLPSATQIAPQTLDFINCALIFSSNIFIAAANELLSPELRKEIDIFVYLEQVKAFFKKHHTGSS